MASLPLKGPGVQPTGQPLTWPGHRSLPAGNFVCVHVSLVPVIGVVGEQKTKPTQHSVAVLRSLGLNPALLACRSSEPLQDSVREKLVGGAGWVNGWGIFGSKLKGQQGGRLKRALGPGRQAGSARSHAAVGELCWGAWQENMK